jgi:2,3-dihydroxybenzoate-AMP ligase
MSRGSFIGYSQAEPDAGLVDFSDGDRETFRGLGLWSGRTLAAELTAAACAHRALTALVTTEVRWTYGELLTRSEAFARGLQSTTDLRPGDPVMFQMGNVAETVIGYLGALLAGLRPVCTLPQHGTHEIGLLAEHVGARALFVQGDFGRGQMPHQAAELQRAGVIEHLVVFRGEAFPGAHCAADIMESGAAATTALAYESMDPWQVAVFQLSGGTTGLPKVAPRMHEEYTYNARAWAQEMGWHQGSVVLYPLPLMHNAGVSLALQPAMLSGATLVLAQSAQVSDILDMIEAERPNAIPLVPPAVAIRILEEPRSRDVDMSCIHDFVVGGQKLPTDVAVRLRDELGISIRQKFGMAEGMFLVTPRNADEWARFNTVGRPISPFDEVRITNPKTGEIMPAGEVGELLARGPYTIRGYYRAPEHNAVAFTADGFYRTGDLAREHRIGDETYYSIEGRIKDVINRGVEKIHAEEVEEIIIGHPDVATAALVAMPDPVLGEKACAYLVMNAGAAPLDVTSLGSFLLSAGLAKYKLPERVETIDRLPLTNVGKVSKKDLRHDVERKLSGSNHND